MEINGTGHDGEDVRRNFGRPWSIQPVTRSLEGLIDWEFLPSDMAQVGGDLDYAFATLIDLEVRVVHNSILRLHPFSKSDFYRF